MNSWSARPIRNRYDRHVQRAHLRVSAGAPRHRLAFAMEEALRLLSLPGEDQGRVYYFRHLRVAGLPPGGERRVWLASFQNTIDHAARQAVHGDDPRAGLAEAVFFHSEPEALEIQLHRLLAKRKVQEWFWPMVTGERVGGSAQSSLPDVVERLRAQPASWVAVAASLFAQPGFDAVGLLRAIPQAVLEGWVHEMDAAPRPRPALPAAHSAKDSPWLEQPAVWRALQEFGPAHPGVLWLGALAALLDSPADLAAGVAVRRAHIALRRLATTMETRFEFKRPGAEKAAEEHFNEGRGRSAQRRRDTEASLSAPARGDLDNETSGLSLAEFRDRATAGRKAETGAVDPFGISPATVPSAAIDRPPSVQDSFLASRKEAASDVLQGYGQSLSPDSGVMAAPLPWLVHGAPTRAAGLFFLLNAMQRIGIAEAVSLSLAIPQFVPRVLLHVVRQAGGGENDPVVTWLHTLVAGSFVDDLPHRLNASWWPGNLQPWTGIATGKDLIRIWSVAVRRWCWRFARVSAGRIIWRNGVFAVNRTELDVTLPIEAADVRLRKAGLDLDPGWLPWFGRVVRFHYVFGGEHHG